MIDEQPELLTKLAENTELMYKELTDVPGNALVVV